jgi:hypothetical protein
MKNQYQGIASLYLLHETDMDEDEHSNMINPETIVAGQLQLTDCNGRIHTLQVMEMLELVKTLFETKIATECQFSD